MLTGRRGKRLPDWLDAVRQDDRPSLRTLAAGIECDRGAVIAGHTLPWSSGVVEGHGNRIKMLKRQMFCRTGDNAPTGRHLGDEAPVDASDPSSRLYRPEFRCAASLQLDA
ncbi:hypothetical protein [Streptomyces sp. NPDC055287]